MAQCNVDLLLSQAACFSCYPRGQQEMIELQLLCEILTGTIAAGACCLYQGDYGGNAPNFTPTQSIAQARDTSAPNVVWWWNGSSWQ